MYYIPVLDAGIAQRDRADYAAYDTGLTELRFNNINLCKFDQRQIYISFTVDFWDLDKLRDNTMLCQFCFPSLTQLILFAKG